MHIFFLHVLLCICSFLCTTNSGQLSTYICSTWICYIDTLLLGYLNEVNVLFQR